MSNRLKHNEINRKSYHKNKKLKNKQAISLNVNLDRYEDYFEEGGLEEVRKWFYEEVLPELNNLFIRYKRIKK